MQDVDLLARARQGDEDAFAQLFGMHERAVYRYATYICGREAADDVVQETFLAVLRQRDRRDAPRGAVVAYLLGIARHVALKRLALREEDVTVEPLGESAGRTITGAQTTVLDTLTRREAVDAVRRAVSSLPIAYREVVVLCDLQEMAYADVAEVLGCPLGTVRSRLHRARALLTSKLAPGPLAPSGD